MNECEERYKQNEQWVTLRLPRAVVDHARTHFDKLLKDSEARPLIEAVLEAASSRAIDRDRDWVVVNHVFTRRGEVEVAGLRVIDRKWDGWNVGYSWDDIRNGSSDGDPYVRYRFKNREQAEVLLRQVQQRYPEAHVMAVPKRRRRRSR